LAVDLDEFDNAELYPAMTEDVLPYLDVSAEGVIVDPSRASLEKRVMEVILD
jgi:hypothetical protein